MRRDTSRVGVSNRGVSRTGGVALGGMLLAALAGTAVGAPEGERVVRGDVSFSRRANEMIIRASHGSIINYRSFDIGRGETVRFIQPDAMSRVLNRIESARPTRIDGTLLSNGRVYLVNPAGVYFGAGSVINVGGLTAAAATMTDDSFLRGINAFTGARGEVINHGTISADFAALIGRHVENNGSIVSPQGTVVMAAGTDVVLGERGGNVFVRVRGEAVGGKDASGSGAAGAVNTGTIDAGRGRVTVGVGDMYGTALFNAGNIRGRQVRLEGQGSGTVAVSGTVDASGAAGNGGNVKILGERVALRDAQIDASGATGGGEVLVGGNFQGRGDERNASRTFVSQGTTIHADATHSGDGGRVVVWSNEATGYNGTITARGGASGGDGGMVEVSGATSLAFQGKADVGAGAGGGRDGSILLDPRDITVQAAAGGDDGQVTPTVDESVVFGDGGGSDFVIGEAALEALTGNVTLQATRDITVSSGVTLDMTNQTAGESLLFQAGRNIAINGTITTGGGGISLSAGDAGSGAADPASTLTLSAALSSAGGAIHLTNTGSGAISLGASVNAGAGDVRLSTGSGGVNQTAGTIAANGLQLLGGGAFSLAQAGNNVSTIAGSLTGALTYTDADALSVGSVGGTNGITTAGDDVSLSSGPMTLAQGLSAGVGNITLSASSGGVTQSAGAITAGGLRLLGAGAFTLTQAGNNVSTIAANVAGAVEYADSNTLSVGTVVTSGITTGGNAVTLTTGGLLTLAQSVSAGGATVTLSTASGGVTQSAGAITAGSLRLLGAGTYTLASATNDVDVLAGNVAGGVTYFDADDVNVGTAVSVGLSTTNGSVILRALTSSVTVSQALNAGSGSVTLLADDLSINAVVTGNAGINLAPITSGQTVGLGGAAGGLNLSLGELTNLASAGIVTIGSATTGQVGTQTLALGGEDYSLTLHGASIALGAVTLNSGKTLTLDAVLGGVTQSGAFGVTNLRLNGAGTFDLTFAGNDADVVAGVVAGNVIVGDADGLEVGTVAGVNGLTTSAGGNVTLNTGGTIVLSQNVLATGARITLNPTAGGVSQTGGAMGAAELRLLGAGAFNLVSATNDVSVAAGSVSGAVNLRDANALEIGIVTNVGLISGGSNVTLTTGGLLTLSQLVNAGAGNLTLNAGGVTQTGGGITASGLELLGTGGFALNQSNSFSTLAGNITGTLSLNDDSALTVGAVGATTGLSVSGNASLSSSPGITIANATTSGGLLELITNTIAVNAATGGASIAIRPVTAGTNIGLGTIAAGLDLSAAELALLTAPGGVTIGATNSGTITTSDIDLSATAYDLTLRSLGAFTLGGLRTGAGRTLTLDMQSGVTQTGAVFADRLRLLGSGDVVLTHSGNDFGVVAGLVGGQVSIADLNAMEIGSVGTGGLSVTGNRNITLSTGGLLTLSQNLSAPNGLARITAAGVNQTGGSVLAQSLALSGTGVFNLASATNDIGTLAAGVAGALTVVDVNALAVGDAGGLEGISTGGGNVRLETGGLLTLAQNVNAGAGNVTLAGAGGSNQSGGAITATGLELLGSSHTLGGNNDVATLASGATGAIVFHDINTLTLGTVNSTLGVSGSGVTVSSRDAMLVAGNVSATGAVDLHSGTNGTGNLSFVPGVAVRGGTIALAAGDGVGGGTSAAVDAVTNAPAFLGAGGAGTSPTAFAIRQDAGIVDSFNLPLLSQFGGAIGGMAYTIESVDGSVILGDGSLVEGTNLSLAGRTGVRMTGAYNVASLACVSPLTLAGSILATGGGGNVTLGSVTLSGASEIGAGGTLSIAQDLNAGANDLTLTGDEIDFAGLLSGTGSLTLQSASSLKSITLGGGGPTGDLDLDALELSRISDGWTQITIGRADGTHIFNVLTTTFRDSAVLRTGSSGNIVVNGALAGVGDAAITLSGPSTLRAGITTQGQAIGLLGPVTMLADVQLDTTGGGSGAGADITVNGTMNADLTAGNRRLTLQGGTGGRILLLGDIGRATDGRLFSVVARGARIEMESVTTSIGQTYTADEVVLGGELTSVTGGAIQVFGNTTLKNAAAVRTAGLTSDDFIMFSGFITSDADGTERLLVLDAGAGDVTIAGRAGEGIELAGLTATGATVNTHGITSIGAVTINGLNRANAGITGGDVVVNGASVIAGDVVANSVVFNGSTTAAGNMSVVGAATFNGDTGFTGNLTAQQVTFNGTQTAISGEANSRSTLTFNAPVSMSGSARGTSVFFNGPLTLTGDTTVIGTTAALFASGVRSLTGNSLTVDSATASFQGAMGDVSGEELGSLSTVGGAVVLGAGVYRTINNISFGGPVTINNDTILASQNGGVSVNGTLDSAGTARALTITGPGEHRLGSVGSLSQLSSVGVTGGTLRLTGATYRTTGSQTYGNSLVDEAAVFSSNGITFGGTLDSGANGAKGVTVAAGAGAAVFTGAVGATSELASMIVTASQVNLGSVRTTGLQTYNGPTELSGNIQTTNDGSIAFNGAVRLAGDVNVLAAGTASNQSVLFAGSVNSITTGHALAVTAGQAGVRFSGDVGAGQGSNEVALSSLTVTGGSVDLRAVRTSGSQGYSGATTLRGNLSSTDAGSILVDGATTLTGDITVTTAAGDITFGSSIDSDSTTRSLTLDSGGNGTTRLRGTVGFTNRLSTLTTNADGRTRLEGGTIRTTTRAQFNDAVTLAADTFVESPNITFAQALDSDNLGTPRALRADMGSGTGASAGSLLFGTNVGSQFAIKSIRTDGTGATLVTANVTTTQGMTYGGPVRLRGASVMDAGGGSAFFRSTLDMDTTFAASSLTVLSSQAASVDATPFRFGGSIGATSPLASLTLGSDLATPARAASIVFTDSFDAGGRITNSSVASTDSFSINTTGDFTMGRGQKLLSLGRLQIKSTNGTVRLGDLTSLADISVEGNAIQLRLRGAGSIFDNVVQTPDQLVTDSGLDLIAAGAIVFNRVPTLDGSGGVSVANNAGVVGGNLSGLTTRQFLGGVTKTLLNDLRSGNSGQLMPLDLKADGPSTAQLASSLAGAIPRNEDRFGQVGSPVTVSKELQDPLSEMGVLTREMSPEESIEFMTGRSIYRDTPGKASPTRTDYRVTVNRLSTGAVQNALAKYRALVFEPTTDASGKPAFDDQGRPVLVKQTARIKETLSSAWDQYTAKVQQPDGAGFRAYLDTLPANGPGHEAMDYLKRTRDVLDAMDGMGLSPFETSIPKNKLLNSLKPGGMTDKQIREAVYGAVRLPS